MSDQNHSLSNASDLIGSNKPTSDVKSTFHRIQYSLSPTVGPASASTNPVRITFPKTHYLDCSSLSFRCKLNVTTSDPNARLDAHTADVLLSRVRVMQGSTLVSDQESNPLIVNQLANYGVSETEYRSFCRYQNDYPQTDDRKSQENTVNIPRELLGKLGPHGTLMNGNHLIPLKMLKNAN